jgi:hypothetical protein
MNALPTDLHENTKMPKRQLNPHIGSNFDDFLKADGIFEEVHAKAVKRMLDEQLYDDNLQTPATYVSTQNI